jgi:hypothetical protein
VLPLSLYRQCTVTIVSVCSVSVICQTLTQTVDCVALGRVAGYLYNSILVCVYDLSTVIKSSNTLDSCGPTWRHRSLHFAAALCTAGAARHDHLALNRFASNSPPASPELSRKPPWPSTPPVRSPPVTAFRRALLTPKTSGRPGGRSSPYTVGF